MTASVPTAPIEKEPIEVIRGKTGKQLGFLLDDALRGIELGSYDRLIIEWLKGWDQGTVVTVASLITRARAAGDEGATIPPTSTPLRTSGRPRLSVRAARSSSSRSVRAPQRFRGLPSPTRWNGRASCDSLIPAPSNSSARRYSTPAGISTTPTPSRPTTSDQ